MLRKRKNVENKKNVQKLKLQQQKPLMGGLENKVEKYLPERKVERKKDGIWEI